MERDGDGWSRCARGHRHWGRYGAAGLLLHTVDSEGALRVLLQQRASWSHQGDTWGLPGGARDSHEDGVTAALREAAEEAGLDRDLIRTRRTYVDDHGGWSYTTVLADVARPVATRANHESHALDWVPADAVGALPLHPGFADSWPRMRVRPVTVLVDAANVVGARPDGWWRDRAGAAAGLLERLAELRAVTVEGPGEEPAVICRVDAVLEGAAAAAPDPGWVRVHRAHGAGDDTLVEVAARLLAEGRAVVAVSADRGLQARWAALPAPGAAGPPHSVGSRWLLDRLG